MLARCKAAPLPAAMNAAVRRTCSPTERRARAVSARSGPKRVPLRQRRSRIAAAASKSAGEPRSQSSERKRARVSSSKNQTSSPSRSCSIAANARALKGLTSTALSNEPSIAFAVMSPCP
jgi:hypothetical protein